MAKTLPVMKGAHGIRSVVHILPSAFLASVQGLTDLIQHMLLESLQGYANPLVASCHNAGWS